MRLFKFALPLVLLSTLLVTRAQQRPAGPTKEALAARNAAEQELQSLAIVERKLMIPMRDGKRMATDVYRPKDTSKKYPIIFVRTPYNFNFWDVRNGAPQPGVHLVTQFRDQRTPGDKGSMVFYGVVINLKYQLTFRKQSPMNSVVI